MKKLFSTGYTDLGFHLAALLLRLGFGILMIPGGYNKWMSYAEKKDDFMSFMGLGGPVSLALLIFAELICAGLLTLGLFTRLVCVPLIIAMSVALFDAHGGDIFGKGKMAGLFLMGYVVVLLVGPGKFSMDKLMGK